MGLDIQYHYDTKSLRLMWKLMKFKKKTKKKNSKARNKNKKPLNNPCMEGESCSTQRNSQSNLYPNMTDPYQFG